MNAVAALALADFRERVRRPAFVAVLLGAVALGYAAVPPASARYAMLRVGEFRGTYDASYVGTAVALVGGLWLSLAGFYVVKNAVARDEASGVGQILAATVLRRPAYLLGKFASNLAVLLAMTAVLAVTALLMLVARGEHGGLDLPALFLPFLLFPLPVMAIGAAGALVFETVSVLKGAAGNVVWFFGWMSAVGSLTVRVAGFDPLGFAAVAASMRPDLLRQYPGGTDTELSAGLVIEKRPPQRFDWSGLDVTAELVVGRLVIPALAVGAVLLASVWFSRFDSGRARPIRSPATVDRTGPAASQAFARAQAPRAPVAVRPRFGTLLAGELRILLRGIRWWWWLGGLALSVTAFAVPARAAAYPLLPLAWLWPAVAWSRLGTQRYEYEVHSLVDSAPARHRRLVAEWTAGLVLTALAGIGPLVRLAAAGDEAGVAAWCAGAVFIPTLALALGTASRSQRLFQAAYLMLWYAVFNRTSQVDFMGVAGADQARGSAIVLAVAAALAACTVLVHEARHTAR
jgi:hypothetical protein